MDRFWNGFKRRASVEEAIEESFDEKIGSEPTTEAAAVPVGYKVIEVQQPDGTVVAVRRKLATWQLTHRDSLTSSRPSSPSPSFRTDISHTSDGKLARVHRSVRDVSAPLGTCSRRVSTLSAKHARDTMRSTMTIVEDALAEQFSSEPEQYSRKDGSAITKASGTAISGTSGDIHIGHIEELNEYDDESDYASSDYDEEQDCCSEDGHYRDETARRGLRKCVYFVLSMI